MNKIIGTEFKKIKRNNILLIGFIGMALPSILSIFTQSVLSTGQDLSYNYEDLFNSTIWNSVTIFMPIIFTLIGGYVINREYTDDTLKNILTIPISFKRLIIAKLIFIGIISLIFAFYNFLITLIVGIINGIEGLSYYIAITKLVQILGITLCTYLAILPIITFTSNKKNSYMGGVILSFILGYSSMFIKQPIMRSLYPISAGFTIFKFDISTFINENTSTDISLSLISLFLCIIISIIIIFFLEPKQKSKENRKNNKKFSRKRNI